jgi:tRNA(adenine34) deaminase
MRSAEANRPHSPRQKQSSARGGKLIESSVDAEADDDFFMGFALAEARHARLSGEVPVGAVVVVDRRVVGRGHNRPITACDPTAHAEVLALREAARAVGNYRLTDATLYVTVEPCAMCAGAIVNARVRRLVYGAADARAGAVDSIFQVCTNSSLNHQVAVTAGVRDAECRALMQAFFQERRREAKAARD